MTTTELDRYVAILEEAADNWGFVTRQGDRAAVLAPPETLTARICRTVTADTYGRGSAA